MKHFPNPISSYIKAKWSFMLFALFAVVNFHTSAQKAPDNLLERINSEDSSYIKAVVLYPDTVRDAIFIASGHPEILIKMDGMTDLTRNEFNTLMAPYDQEMQSQFWELSRYPHLLDQLTMNGQLTKKEIEYISYGYPDDVKAAALNSGMNEYSTLSKINGIEDTYKASFDQLINPYSTEVQKAYRTLIEMPEVLEILSGNLRTTILIGDAYKKDPQGIRAQAEKMNLEIARENAQELADWKKELAEDPEAMKEFESSAKLYAQEQGYNASDYNNSASNTVIYVQNYPYPYWFGYPNWHSYSYWYPYPWWYDWGYYYGPSNQIVFIGLPSHQFFYWYFNYQPHHYHYSHFTNHCLHHHNRHHRSYAGMNVVVSNWQRDNKEFLKESWLSDNNQRVDRIQEFGRLAIEQEDYNQANPKNPLDRGEFLEANARNYPTLAPYKEPIVQKLPSIEKPTNPYTPYKPYEEKPVVKPQTEKLLQQSAPYQTKPVKTPMPVNLETERNKAKDHHQNTWERKVPSTPVVKPRNPVVTPRTPVVRPTPTTPRKTTPTRTTPSVKKGTVRKK